MISDMFTGPFSHDLMVEVMLDLFPALQPGKDYAVGHFIDPATDTQQGDPFFMSWKSLTVAQPDPQTVKAAFVADESKYRGSFCRRYRDACLAWSDSKATAPPDAPAAVQALAAQWQTYREALRNVPGQTGFPLVINWPAMPA